METLESLRGQVLQSGALCIDSKKTNIDGEFVVLAFRTHPVDPYVVWNADSAGNCWRGDYCRSLAEAQAMYERRS